MIRTTTLALALAASGIGAAVLPTSALAERLNAIDGLLQGMEFQMQELEGPDLAEDPAKLQAYLEIYQRAVDRANRHNDPRVTARIVERFGWIRSWSYSTPDQRREQLARAQAHDRPQAPADGVRITNRIRIDLADDAESTDPVLGRRRTTAIDTTPSDVPDVPAGLTLSFGYVRDSGPQRYAHVGTLIPPGAVFGEETSVLDSHVRRSEGFGVSAIYDLGGGSLFHAGYTRTRGEATASATLDPSSPDGLGLTYYEQADLGGGATSTGLFLGSSFGMRADIDQRVARDSLEIGYEHEVIRDGNFGLNLGVSLNYDDYRYRERSNAEVLYSGAPYGGIAQTNRFDVDQNRYGASVSVRPEVQLTGRAGGDGLVASLLGTAGVVFVDSDARFTQNTSCSVCGPGQQSVGFSQSIDGTRTGFAGSVGGHVSYTFGDWTIGAGISHGTEPHHLVLDQPVNPTEQPGGLRFRNATRTQIAVSLSILLGGE